MKLVIDIPEMAYEAYKEWSKNKVANVEQSLISQGIPYEERPKGKWKIIGLVDDYAYCTCSECGKTTRLYRDSENEFCCIADIRKKAVACLYCGADMRGDI